MMFGGGGELMSACKVVQPSSSVVCLWYAFQHRWTDVEKEQSVLTTTKSSHPEQVNAQGGGRIPCVSLGGIECMGVPDTGPRDFSGSHTAHFPPSPPASACNGTNATGCLGCGSNSLQLHTTDDNHAPCDPPALLRRSVSCYADEKLTCRALKQSTGITGLAVHPKPLPALKTLYSETLLGLSAIPSSSAYRQATEAITNHRLQVVEKAGDDITAVERELGQMVEVIIQEAESEKELVSNMAEWKA